MTPPNRILLYQEHLSDIQHIDDYLKSFNFSAIVTPLVYPRFPREFDDETIKTKHLYFSRSDLILTSKEWCTKVIAKISEYIDCDSNNECIRKLSEKVLLQEISFANHLVQASWIKINSSNTINLARLISYQTQGTIFAEIPMVNPKTIANQYRNDKSNELDRNEENEIKEEDTWMWWNKLRSYADFSPRLKLALELASDIPSTEEIHRWLGEPVEILIIPSHVFIMNKNNFPVLSKAHQEVVAFFVKNNNHFTIKANINDPQLVYYVEYIKMLIDRHYVVDSMADLEDVLEIPLEPLYENLDCYTYEIFEKDPVKYKLYQNAIEQALCDRVPEENIEKVVTTIMVLGAGRGPLIRSALNASANTKRKILIYVVEKNPNAIVTLQSLIGEMWNDRNISFFKCDMRDFNPPSKADILVSELLGSFGDNELSPECLDGAQKHLKPDGISIPCKSTSYINPTMSSKIYNNIRMVDRHGNQREKLNTYTTNAESTYVVYIKKCYHISRPQPVFEFIHPNLNKIIDNTRNKTLEFEAKVDCVINGFTGYFDSVLYKDIKISIHPETHTPGMFSWFCYYFPIHEPQQVRAGQKIKLNIWRCVGAHKVWYEWMISEPNITHIHNLNGRSSSIHM